MDRRSGQSERSSVDDEIDAWSVDAVALIIHHHQFLLVRDESEPFLFRLVRVDSQLLQKTDERGQHFHWLLINVQFDAQNLENCFLNIAEDFVVDSGRNSAVRRGGGKGGDEGGFVRIWADGDVVTHDRKHLLANSFGESEPFELGACRRDSDKSASPTANERDLHCAVSYHLLLRLRLQLMPSNARNRLQKDEHHVHMQVDHVLDKGDAVQRALEVRIGRSKLVDLLFELADRIIRRSLDGQAADAALLHLFARVGWPVSVNHPESFQNAEEILLKGVERL